MVVAGIDIGGTFIKGGICSMTGEILINGSVKTECNEAGLVAGVKELIFKLLTEKGIAKSELAGVGIGIPGMIDGAEGCIRYSNNLKLTNFYIVKELKKSFDIPIEITNDANAAALGEAKFGTGKGKTGDSILVTLGTGVGGGIVLDGKIFSGTGGAGAELGHMGIIAGGELCTCGRRGCLEAYASATALIRQTKDAMKAHPESAMWKKAKSLGDVDGQTAFSCADSDLAAKAVVDKYIEFLGEGLVSFGAIFRPARIMLGGGISKEGERLTKPLQKYINDNLFGGDLGPRVEITVASLGNKAGLMGAAALVMD